MIDLEPGWLIRLQDSGTLLALLILGHVVADFVAQTDEMVRSKKKLGGMVRHGALVAVVQAISVAPFATWKTVFVVAALAVAHVLIDAVKVRFRQRTRLQASLFLGDQAAHLLLVLAAWRIILAADWWTPQRLPMETMALTTAALLLAAYAFAWNGGGAIVRELLLSRGADPVETPNQMGKLIGCLERWIVITLVLLSQWAAIAFVFAAKSIARFKQMEDRPFAEYYLVGTLASLVVGTALGLSAAWALGI